MPLALSSDDHTRLVAAATALLSPLQFSSREEWYLAVGGRLEELLDGDATMVVVAGPLEVTHISVTAPELAAGFEEHARVERGELRSDVSALDRGISHASRIASSSFTSTLFDRLSGGGFLLAGLLQRGGGPDGRAQLSGLVSLMVLRLHSSRCLLRPQRARAVTVRGGHTGTARSPATCVSGGHRHGAANGGGPGSDDGGVRRGSGRRTGLGSTSGAGAVPQPMLHRAHSLRSGWSALGGGHDPFRSAMVGGFDRTAGAGGRHAQRVLSLVGQPSPGWSIWTRRGAGRRRAAT